MKSRVLSFILAIGLLTTISFGSVGGAVAAPSQGAHVASVSGAHTHFLDKTRFLVHMGLAYYAFHHWVIIPWQHKAFNSGASHRTSTIIKAGLATLFAAHEVSVAYGIAEKSNSKLLHALVSPIKGLMNLASSIGAKLKKGQYSSKDLTNLSDSVTSVGKSAAKNGYGIKDITTAIPGL